MAVQQEQITEQNNKEEESSLLQGFFLSRLQGFVLLSQEPDLADWERELVKRAVYSVYLDCLAAGIAGDARKVLEGREPRTSGTLAVRN